MSETERRKGMDKTQLSVIGHSNGFNLWHYRCSAGEDPRAVGFWNDAASMLRPGDVIHVTAEPYVENGWTFAPSRIFTVDGRRESTGEVMVGPVS